MHDVKETTVEDSKKNPDEPTAAPKPESQVSPPAGGGASAAVPQQDPRGKLEIDDSHAMTIYANFCRVTGSPEEVILDFALNSRPFEPTGEAVSVTHRIVTNPYTAKRLIYALQMAVERHEAAFGTLETNVVRRLRPGGSDEQQRAAPF